MMWDASKHHLRARLLISGLIEVNVLRRSVLRRHLNPLMVLEYLVLIRDPGRQLSHFTDDDLLAVADQLTCRLFKPWVRPHLINLL